jgi:fucose 4-O-acetylase-like acetyltransferase
MVPVPRLPDRETSQTIGLLRWVLMVLVVVIHTNLVPDAGAVAGRYASVYHAAEHVVWLANPLFFLISGYLFMASSKGFSMRLYGEKLRRRLHTWLLPYLLWNALFLCFYMVASLRFPAMSGVVPSVHEIRFTDVLEAFVCIRGEGLNSGPIDGPLWFLRDLMVLALLLPLCYGVMRLHRFSLIVPLLLGVLPYKLGFEYELASFMIGCYLNLWLPDMAAWLKRPVWVPLCGYAAAVALLSLPWQLPAPLSEPLLFVRNLFGMLLIARLCMRVVCRHHSFDWRNFARPVFFVFALHSLFARVLTKYAAGWLVAHHAGCMAFVSVQLLNVACCIGLSLAAYLLLGRLAPAFCRLLAGFQEK